MAQEVVVIPNGRCIRLDHDWDLEDCYQFVNGQWVMRTDVDKAQCSSCWLTMREATERLAADLITPHWRAITPQWRGEFACYAPSLTAEQRMALARESTPELRGEIACDAAGLTAEQRIELAHASTPRWRGRVACYAPGLTAEQRMDLAYESTPEMRGRVARDAPDLTPEQRMELRRQG